MSTKILAAVCFLGAICSLAGVAACAQSQSKEVKKAPVQTTAANSGSEMFHSYCAPCHGTDGKGNGPAAASLKNPPANLRELAKKNKGEFPADHVATVLRSGVSGTHGSSDCPSGGQSLPRSAAGTKDSCKCAFRIWSATWNPSRKSRA
jgi:cytochrome c553